MINAKWLIASSAGLVGLWKFWPAQSGWHPILIAVCVIFGLWLALVVAICAMDYHRRHTRTKPLPLRGLQPPW
jgi:hypothetical protein